MKKKNEKIEVTGVLVPADPEEIAKIINNRYPKINDAVSTSEIKKALEDGTIPVSGGMVEDKALWTFVDTNCDLQGMIDFMNLPAYEKIYGPLTGATYDKHKRQVLRLKKKISSVQPFKSLMFCTNTATHELEKHKTKRKTTWMKNLTDPT